MSVTSGFFNSLNHDRRYSAQQMSAIFDGIINDGVFANIGVAFAITADSGVTINIGVGKAWFNSAWVYNDALLPKTLEGSEVVLDRIDAVVIEVDHNESVRMGDIKIVKGSPSSSPKNPALANTANKHQYPLAYIYRKAGSTEITQADITNMVGTSSCPYITGILQVQNIDNIVAQWEGQWNQWYASKIAETDTDASELLAEMKSEFDIWFNDIQALLEDDVATALAAQVAELQGKFDILAREGAVYDTIEDSDFDPILGSDGTPIQGKTVFGGGGNIEDIDLSAYAKKEDLEKIETAKLDRTEKFEVNLADNSDFTQFVAQAGIGGKHGNRAYAGDRWILDSGTVTGDKREDGNGYDNITLNGTIRQIVANVPDVGTAAIEMVSGTADISYENGAITITSNGGVIKNVRLFKGSIAADNMAEYQPTEYGAELAECKRYYRVLRCDYKMVPLLAKQMRFRFENAQMRIIPRVEILELPASIRYAGKDVELAGVSLNSVTCKEDSLLVYLATTTSLEAYNTGYVQAMTLELNADFPED